MLHPLAGRTVLGAASLAVFKGADFDFQVFGSGF
jgi:hypothetical protein